MKRFYKYLFMLCLILCCSLLPAVKVEASGIKQIEGLNDQTNGPARFMQDQYRDNYSLDVDKVGLLDGLFEVFNGIANVIFSMVKFVAYAAICFFYYSLTFDITATFSDELNAIQGLLRNSIFEPLLILGFFFSGITILKRFLQQNMVGILSELCKVIVLILISILLVNDSETILTTTSGITKSISLSAFTGVNSLENDANETLQNYAVDAAGILWQNMVHEPWKSLEFGGYITFDDDSAELAQFLSSAPGSEERENLVAQYADTKAFSKGRVFTKIGNCLIYLIVIAIKSILYIAVAGIMFTYQIFSIFYLLIAPLILILAFFPSYQSIVNVWFKKFIETQVCIFIITLVLGLIVKLDSIIFGAAGDLGWFMALIFQIATIFFLYKERDKIIHAFSNVQKAIEVPAYANAMLRNRMNAQNLPKTVNQIKNIPNAARTTISDAQNAAAHTKETITNVATRVSLGMHGMGWTKAGMEKRAEEAAVHDTMQKMTIQHSRPDLYKTMQKQEQENEKMKNYGTIRLRMAAADKTLNEMRVYEKEKERTEKNAVNAEKKTTASAGYSNIIKFEDRPRLHSKVPPQTQTVRAAVAKEALVNMRSNDDKTITVPVIERPTLNRDEKTSPPNPQRTEALSSDTDIQSAPALSPSIGMQNIQVVSSGTGVQDAPALTLNAGIRDTSPDLASDTGIQDAPALTLNTGVQDTSLDLASDTGIQSAPNLTQNTGIQNDPGLAPGNGIQNAQISVSETGTSKPSSDSVSVQNQGIQGTKEVTQKQTAAYSHTQAQTASRTERKTEKKHTPKASGTFTAIEANAPIHSKNKKEERPKLNTGQYKETESSAPKHKTAPPKITSAKKIKK